MHKIHSAIATLSAALLLGGAGPAAAQFYAQHNLVSDVPGLADLTDASLVNAWGLASSATSPWWVSNNGTDTSTLYNGNTGTKLPLAVNVPGAPTGVVFNPSTGFRVSNGSTSAPARFIFATEEGTIRGWNPAVAPTDALIAVDQTSSGAIYKGLAIATTPTGTLLYATNFHAGRVEVWDAAWNPVAASFADPDLPDGYAPFGIQQLAGIVYVTYAQQDADKTDDVPGQGHGFVNAFDPAGHLLGRVASREQLNSPWGLALAPQGFGRFSGDLLVGNFGDGKIHAFDPTGYRRGGEYQKRGPLHSSSGAPIVIEGLWALAFGTGGGSGPTTTLFFTAGPSEESHGLFGSLLPAPPPGDDEPEKD